MNRAVSDLNHRYNVHNILVYIKFSKNITKFSYITNIVLVERLFPTKANISETVSPIHMILLIA